jgi:hypothetical protein
MNASCCFFGSLGKLCLCFTFFVLLKAATPCGLMAQGFLVIIEEVAGKNSLTSSDPKEEPQVQLYPNPSYGTIYLQPAPNEEVELLRIFDGQGNLVLETDFPQPEIAHSLSPGTYSFLIYLAGGEVVTKTASLLPPS